MNLLKYLIKNDEEFTILGYLVVGIIFIFGVGILGYLALTGFCEMIAMIFMGSFTIKGFIVSLLKFSIGAGIFCGFGAAMEMG